MLKLNNDRDAGISIVDDPDELFSRLSRLDLSGSELANHLNTLPSNRLREILNQIEIALGYAEFEENKRRGEELRTINRAASFGD